MNDLSDILFCYWCGSNGTYSVEKANVLTVECDKCGAYKTLSASSEYEGWSVPDPEVLQTSLQRTK